MSIKVKKDMNGAVRRLKAQWVVQGYLQQFRIDFNQTFAAVVKSIAFKVLFAITAYYNLDIDQIDIKTCFLYEVIDQLVYIEILKGSEIMANKRMIYKLLKAFYKLK